MDFLLKVIAVIIMLLFGYLFIGAVINTILETIYLFEDIFSKKEKEISTDEIQDDDDGYDRDAIDEFLDKL